MDFAGRLRELRMQKGLSQEELAKRLGLSNSAISMYERGSRKPSLELLETLQEFFNVDIAYLLGQDKGNAYYLDPEVAELARTLYERPEMRVLFDASRKATKEDIEAVANILEKMSNK